MDDLVKRLGKYGHAATVGGIVADYSEKLAIEARDRIEALEAENRRMRTALTPSGETKVAYMGEVKCDARFVSPAHDVPWAAIKEIMAMIRRHAGITG